MTQVPQSLDRFDIARILGKGGMGTVYLARDVKLDRPVAIKVLHLTEFAYDDRRARFLREARTAAAIRHQNVATIYEVGETDGLPYIVMEYCEGETLAQRIRRRTLEPAEFLQIARQLAAGVAAAHDVGIVHRDLKAPNVMIEPTGVVKILDFGLAKPLHHDFANPLTIDSTVGHVFGTIHYLAPEQARGQPSDERSDLFSLGVVFYQMATGQLPFNADAPLLVLDKIRDAEPEPFVPLDSTFPAAAARIIGKLLKKNPAERYQTARELVADLDDLQTASPRHTTLPTSRRSIGRTVHHTPVLRLTLIAITTVIVGVAIYLAGHASKTTADIAPGPLPPIRSMAVLPLENISNNIRDDFLSVGLADALVTKLQQIPSLQVRPTSAVLEFRSKKVDAKAASEKLKVDGLLEGHFLAAGNLVRVNLQLTDSRTGYSVWADSVDGKREDLLRLIDDVSLRTVAGLNQKLGVPERTAATAKHESTNPKAYEQYLRARALNGSLVPSEHRAQVAALKQAIALDPNFAAAYADLAVALSLGQARALDTEPDVMQKTEWYARQAVRLDPNLAAAHLAMSRTFVRLPDRFRESVRENLAAIRLNSRESVALHSLATYFVAAGDMEKAQCVTDHLVAADPDSNEAKTRGYFYVNGIDARGAAEAAKAALAAKDTEAAGHDILALADILLGDLNGASAEAQRVSALLPNHYLGKSLHAMIAAANGNKSECQTALASFEADANHNHWAAMRQSFCYAKLGDHEQAVRWMQRSAELGNHNWYAWVKHPWMQSLQSDGRYQQTLAKMKADVDDVRDDVIGVYQLICR